MHTANPLILYTLIPPSFPVIMIIIIQLPARPSKKVPKRGRDCWPLFLDCHSSATRRGWSPLYILPKKDIATILFCAGSA